MRKTLTSGNAAMIKRLWLHEDLEEKAEHRNTMFGNISKPQKTAAEKQPDKHGWTLPEKPSHEHIVKNFEEADHESMHSGMNWYHRAHHFAKSMGGHLENGLHKSAGVIAAYSPNTAWPVNFRNAARAMKNGKGHGGAGSGMATLDMASKTDRILSGEHHQDVLGGHKTRNFAHIIENPHTDHHVCVDRHALSISLGRKLTGSSKDKEYVNAMGDHTHYQHVADQYRSAAKHLSKKYGKTIHPHQVQAVTWEHWRKKHKIDDSYNEDGARTKVRKEQGALFSGAPKSSSKDWDAGVMKAHGHDPKMHEYKPVHESAEVQPELSENDSEEPKSKKASMIHYKNQSVSSNGGSTGGTAEVTNGRHSMLFSYATPVAHIDHKAGKAHVTDKKWSKSTTRHVNEFLKHHGYTSHETVSQDSLHQKMNSRTRHSHGAHDVTVGADHVLFSRGKAVAHVDKGGNLNMHRDSKPHEVSTARSWWGDKIKSNFNRVHMRKDADDAHFHDIVFKHLK